MNEKDNTRLRDMLDNAQRAIKFASGKQRNDLDSDEMLAFAIVRCLEIVGEAASQVSSVTRLGHPQIEWRKIVGMRNRVIHDYGNVDLNIVWETVVMILPELITKLEQILPPE